MTGRRRLLSPEHADVEVRLINVTKVRALDGYRLDLSFSDGTGGVADLSGDLTGPLAALLDDDLWGRAYLQRGVVAWNGSLDLAPEFLYACARQL